MALEHSSSLAGAIAVSAVTACGPEQAFIVQILYGHSVGNIEDDHGFSWVEFPYLKLAIGILVTRCTSG